MITDPVFTQELADFVAEFPSSVYLIDKNGIILGCSNSVAKSIGWQSYHDVIGLRLNDLLDSRYSSDVISKNDHVLQHGESLEGEIVYPDGHGGEKVYLFNKVPLRNSLVGVWGMLSFSVDITAQKKLDEKILEIERLEREKNITKRHLGEVLSLVPCPIYWKNLEGEYLGCNESHAVLAGFKSAKDVIGLTDFEMSWKHDAEAFRAADRQVVERGSALIVEEMMSKASGEATYWLSRKEPLMDDCGNVIGVIGASIDVTAQKENERLERERVELEKRELERKLEIQDEFRKIVMQANHDMGSPLLVLDLFARKYLESAPEDQRNSVRDSIK